MNRVRYYSSAGNSNRSAHYLTAVVEKGGLTRALCGEGRRVWRPIPEANYGTDHRMCPDCAAAEPTTPKPAEPVRFAPRGGDGPRVEVTFEQARPTTFAQQVAASAGFLRSITHHRIGVTDDGQPIYGDRIGADYSPRDAALRADQHAAHLGLLDTPTDPAHE